MKLVLEVPRDLFAKSSLSPLSSFVVFEKDEPCL